MTRSCRSCGCTDDRGCPASEAAAAAGYPPTCSWIEEDLCSACEDHSVHEPVASGHDDGGAPVGWECALCGAWCDSQGDEL